jgi:uncharacterized protein YkwD
MKYHFLGTFCLLATIIGITATTAQADVSIDTTENQTVAATAPEKDPVTPGTTTPTTQAYNPQSAKDPVTPGTAAPTTQAYNNPQSTSAPMLNNIELTTFNLVNKYRQSKNLPPLEIDPAISAIAKKHSEEMARVGKMSHDGFNERTDSVSQTIVFRSAAENVAYNMGYGQPDLVAVQGWIESPGHQRNMVGRYDLTGIGVVKSAKGEYFFTQIFVRKAWYVKDADTN